LGAHALRSAVRADRSNRGPEVADGGVQNGVPRV
jgi:hypothetical protein